MNVTSFVSCCQCQICVDMFVSFVLLLQYPWMDADSTAKCGCTHILLMLIVMRVVSEHLLSVVLPVGRSLCDMSSMVVRSNHIQLVSLFLYREECPLLKFLFCFQLLHVQGEFEFSCYVVFIFTSFCHNNYTVVQTAFRYTASV